MVRGVRPHAVGRRVAAVRRPRGGKTAAGAPLRPIAFDPAPGALAARVRGRLVEAVERRAKRVVLRLSGGLALAIEPRMTGLMLLGAPPTAGHVRLELHLDPGPDGPAEYPVLRFWDRRGLGTVRLYEPGELEVRLGPDKLGPDPLTMTPADWRAALNRTARPVKVALLDQKLAAGVGNLYASEALFHARIPPDRPASALTKKPRSTNPRRRRAPRCWRRRSNTRAARCRTAPTSTPWATPAATGTSTACTSGAASPARGAARRSCAPCRPSGAHSTAWPVSGESGGRGPVRECEAGARAKFSASLAACGFAAPNSSEALRK